MKNLARYSLLIALLIACVLIGSPAGATHEDKKFHHLVIQITDSNKAAMMLGLDNAVNVAIHYGDLAEEVEIEIIAYGPGLHMLREDTSPVKDRLKSIIHSIPAITFTACGNTKTTMEKTEGKPITLLPQANVVKTGVARLMELQEKGWTYVRP